MRMLLGWAIAGMAVAMMMFAFSVASDADSRSADYGLDNLPTASIR